MLTMLLRRLKLSALILLLVGVGILAFTAYQGQQLASPERRELQPYHFDWLDQPENHGIEISRSLQLNQQVPCLTVTAHPDGKLGQRGHTIRKQLLDRGIKLAPPGNIIGNLVLLHGRNGRKEDLLPVAERFCAIGLRCIIPDLPAHGESPVDTAQFGLSELERDLPQRLLVECAETQGFQPAPSALWGMSMGGCLAIRAASTGGAWSSLTIVSSFNNLEHTIHDNCHSQILTDITSYFCQQYGGAKLSAVTPGEWAQSITVPTLIAHGTEDSLIQLETGKILHRQFRSKHKRWIEVPGGDHDDVLITPMPLYSEMASWIMEHLRSPE